MHDVYGISATAECSGRSSVDTERSIDTSGPIHAAVGIGDAGYWSSSQNDDAAGVVSELKLSDQVSEVPLPGIAPDPAVLYKQKPIAQRLKPFASSDASLKLFRVEAGFGRRLGHR